MGYRHIEQLYKNRTVLAWKQVYCLEKIHGSSAHLSWNGPEKKLTYFSGGEKYENFVKIFDEPALIANLVELFSESRLTIYGEVYGGRCQKMSDTYGPVLRFVAFELMFTTQGDRERWYNVPDAEQIVKALGLDFVSYNLVDATIEEMDKQRDLPSEQAFKNGMAKREDPSTWKKREGVVIRPPMELYDFQGGRFLAKHKSEEFAEREHTPKLQDPEATMAIADGKKIAQEFVTPMRLQHILDRAKVELNIEPNETKYIPDLIRLMIEDVGREAAGEIVMTKQATKWIGNRTAELFRQHLQDSLHTIEESK